MSANAKDREIGYQCPVRGCDKRRNRRFSLLGLVMHMVKKHDGEVEKRLRAKVLRR